MAILGDVVHKVRSKNAGPFWLTIDVFCGNEEAFQRIENQLSTEIVAQQLHQPEDRLNRYVLPDLHVIKFSLPRPQVQGSRLDRDMHGAQWAITVSNINLDG
ncbi:MAG: DUF4387 family protein [Rhizobiaceae bacterium]